MLMQLRRTGHPGRRPPLRRPLPGSHRVAKTRGTATHIHSTRRPRVHQPISPLHDPRRLRLLRRLPRARHCCLWSSWHLVGPRGKAMSRPRVNRLPINPLPTLRRLLLMHLHGLQQLLVVSWLSSGRHRVWRNMAEIKDFHGFLRGAQHSPGTLPPTGLLLHTHNPLLLHRRDVAVLLHHLLLSSCRLPPPRTSSTSCFVWAM